MHRQKHPALFLNIYLCLPLSTFFGLLGLVLAPSQAPAQEIDPNFRVEIMNAGPISKILTLPEDEVLVAGNFWYANSERRGGLVRLLADGSTDPTFTAAPELAGNVRDLLRQPDGKLILVTDAPTYNGTPVGRILRLEANGDLDPGFRFSDNQIGFIEHIYLLNSGQLIVGGNGSSVPGQIWHVHRLQADGSLDNSYQVPEHGGILYGLGVDTADRVLVSGQFGFNVAEKTSPMIRLDTAGALDNTFSFPPTGDPDLFFSQILPRPNGETAAIADGLLYLFSEDFKSWNFFSNPQNIGTLSISDNNNVFLGQNSAFGVGGERVGTVPNNQIFRLSAQNALTPFSFGDGADQPITAIAALEDGSLIAGGSFVRFNLETVRGITRIGPDGTVDGTFFASILSPGLVRTIALQGEKILIGGRFFLVNGRPIPHLARLNRDGSLDAGFDQNAAQPNRDIYSIHILSNGNLFIASQYRTGAEGQDQQPNGLDILSPDGEATPTLGYHYREEAGFFKFLDTPPSGAIYLGGFFAFESPPLAPDGFARLKSDFSIDAELDATITVDYIEAVTVQPDQRPILMGKNISLNGRRAGDIVRLSTENEADPTFVLDATLEYKDIRRGALLPDGKLFVAGEVDAEINDRRFTTQQLVRLDPDGRLDPSFKEGILGPFARFELLYPLPDGRLLVSGNSNEYNGIGTASAFIINANGVGFTPVSDQLDGILYAAAPDNDNQLYIAGGLQLGSEKIGTGIARLKMVTTAIDQPTRRPTAPAVRLWPNPVGEGQQLTIELREKASTDIGFRLLDNQGRPVFGSGRIRKGEKEHQVWIRGMSSGYYFLELTDGRQRWGALFLKQ